MPARFYFEAGGFFFKGAAKDGAARMEQAAELSRRHAEDALELPGEEMNVRIAEGKGDFLLGSLSCL